MLIFVAFLPLLAISLFLGRRGPLLDAFFVVAVGRTYALSLRRLRPKLVMSLLAVYFVMGMIFVNRAIIVYAAYSGDASDLVTRAFERGLLLLKSGIYSNCIRVLTPLVISDAELDEALGVWEQALDASLA